MASSRPLRAIARALPWRAPSRHLPQAARPLVTGCRMVGRRVAGLLLAGIVVSATLSRIAWAEGAVTPASHHALYDLTLRASRGDVTTATGSMEYETADACDGWATRQRLALEITNRDGQPVELVSDYATWESKDGLRLRFRMRQTTDGGITDQAEGSAELRKQGGPGVVHYTVPEEKDVPLVAGTVFPMAHTEAIINAAARGARFLTLPIFDGTGSKGGQDSSVAIIDWRRPGPPAPDPALVALPSTRVRIAFFDRAPPPPTADRPTGTPDYEVGMRYWANGVADDLDMDFGDFVMHGTVRTLKLEAPHC